MPKVHLIRCLEYSGESLLLFVEDQKNVVFIVISEIEFQKAGGETSSGWGGSIERNIDGNSISSSG